MLQRSIFWRQPDNLRQTFAQVGCGLSGLHTRDVSYRFCWPLNCIHMNSMFCSLFRRIVMAELAAVDMGCLLLLMSPI